MQHQAAILTISDKASRGEREDTSGPTIKRELANEDIQVVEEAVCPDEIPVIAARLEHYADEMDLSLVITTGGTGLSPRDVTPEATAKIMDREVPGMAEAIRAEGLKHTSRAMLSRGLCALRKQTLIVNLPGSPKGVLEGIAVILPSLAHGLDKLRGDREECAR